MRVNKTKQAFTLIEMLVVITIIGIVSTAALVVLKDTGEVKALQYTKKVMKAMKNGIAEKEEGRVFSGFLNDFGTMPPNAHFLLNIENNANFVAKKGEDDTEKLGRFKIKNFKKYNSDDHDGRIIPMPFMDDVSGTLYTDGDTDIPNENGSILYVGFHGGYLVEGIDGSDKERSLKDGWSNIIEFITDLNISTASTNDRYLTIRSKGSDGFLDNNESENPLKDEFNEYKNSDSIKNAYKDDINISYRYNSFIPKRLICDVNSTRKYVIYSPMIYYVEDSSGKCTEYDHKRAECPKDSGIYKDYKPYHFDTNTTINRDGFSWHVGIIKYKIYDGNISINDEYNITVDNATSKDFSEDFYISAGEKKIIRLDEPDMNITYMKTFMPNQDADITYDD